MNLIECIFSKSSEHNSNLILSSKKYSFLCESPLFVGDILFSPHYHKYLHVVGCHDSMGATFFSFKENRFSEEMENRSFFPLRTLKLSDKYKDDIKIIEII